MTTAGEVTPAKTLVRVIDSSDGLPSSTVMNVAQDDRGIIWAATAGGLARLDGQRVLALPSSRCDLVPGSGTAGRIVIRAAGKLSELSGNSLVPIAGPDGRAFDEITAVAIDTRARIWVVSRGRLFREDAELGWVVVDTGAVTTATIQSLNPASDGAVLAGANSGLFRIDRVDVSRVSGVGDVVTAIERVDRSIVFLANVNRNSNNGGAVFSASGGVTRRLFGGEGFRAIALTTLGEDLIADFDSGLWRIAPSGSAVKIDTGSVLHCCGGILADRENSLWVATEAGLLQMPSPESSGLVPGALDMALDEGGAWFSTWSGTGLARVADGGLSVARLVSAFGFSPCRAPTGDVWVVSPGGRTRIHGEHPPETFPGPGFGGYFSGCSGGGDGRFWMASDEGILVGDAASPIPHPIASRVPATGENGDRRGTVLERSTGELFFATTAGICHARVHDVLSRPEAQWSCRKLTGAFLAPDLAELPGGTVWAAVVNVGVLRWTGSDGDDWEVVPASQALRVSTIAHMRSSPRGGVWILAERDIERIVEDRSSAGGWRVLERLGTGQGVDEAVAPRDIAEAPDGTIWLTARDGSITHIPASARERRDLVPRVFLSDVLVDDRALPVTVDLTLPSGRNRLELRFSVPVFRDPSRLRFRYRLRDDDPWSAPSRETSLRFAGLGSGRYEISAQAALDVGGDPQQASWTPEPARIGITILRPWYLRWWSFASFAGIVAAVAFATHRARVRGLLRLERQRARIARDLHDEIGSGLGSIGLLAGMARRAANDPDGASEMVEQIWELSAELGTSLTDIVTSLRAGALNLRSLYGHLVERGTRLCAEGPELRAAPLESIPELTVSVPVRLNVLLIGAEAIHNVVRHADATRVRVSFEFVSSGTWSLRVEDDGRGFARSSQSPRAVGPGGVGLESMRARAAQLGASIRWFDTAGGGTTVELLFQPTAEDRGLRA